MHSNQFYLKARFIFICYRIIQINESSQIIQVCYNLDNIPVVEESDPDFETFYENGLELILDCNEDRTSDKGSFQKLPNQ